MNQKLGIINQELEIPEPESMNKISHKCLGQNGDKTGTKNPRTRELFCVNLSYLFGGGITKPVY